MATQIFLCLAEIGEKSIFWIPKLIFDDFIEFYAQKLTRLPILVKIGALLRFGLVLAMWYLLVTVANRWPPVVPSGLVSVLKCV